MRRLGAAAVAALAAIGGACGGERSPLGLDEPLRVQGAVFKEGALPGAPPDASGAPGPQVTTLESVNNVLRPRQAGKRVGGRTSTDGRAVGVRFEGLGSGYWQFGVDSPDPTAGGELTWEAAFDLGHGVPPGLHRLLFAAIDDGGQAGPQRALNVCVTPPYPDNLNACDPTIEPPAAILSLTWDADVDLDLVVTTPDGIEVDPKRLTTSPLSEAGTPALPPTAPGVGVIDRDSNGGCVLDATRRENLVWATTPRAGTYQVRARLFDACGRDSVRFVASLLLPAPRADGAGKELVEQERLAGELLAIDAQGGTGPGLFVKQFTFR